MNVYYFSYWAIAHKGNDNFPGPTNPIKKWARNGQTTIQLPGSHVPLMKDRWAATVDKNIWLLGRFGDVVDFASLPYQAQQVEVAHAVGAYGGAEYELGGAVEACGSAGEVASNALLGHRYRTYLTAQEKDMDELLFPHSTANGKSMAWYTAVLGAPDQLRHRVAFALSQILVVGVEGLGKPDETELWLNWYDIFVRNAFGSYRDLLKQVSFSPLMSHYLTFHGNKAYAYAKTHPDENYAREIMQCVNRILTRAPRFRLYAAKGRLFESLSGRLFSIGLYYLNPDGSRVMDASGEPIPTYDNVRLSPLLACPGLRVLASVCLPPLCSC